MQLTISVALGMLFSCWHDLPQRDALKNPKSNDVLFDGHRLLDVCEK
jgi:hypothetical protein